MSTFPQPFKSTVSHWQATNRGKNTLYNHGCTDSLPAEVVDYAIIGAGICGSALAYSLTRPGVADDKTIIVLEAKDVASGASGRNGGHVAPYSFASFPQLTTPLSSKGAGLSNDEALQVMQLERENLRYVKEVVKEEGWDVDLWTGEKLEVQLTEESCEKMRKARKAWVKARENSRFKGTEPDWDWIDDDKEARKISRIPAALGLGKGPAGSVHPHKLCTSFISSAIRSSPKGKCRLFSWCPVTSFTQAQAAEREQGLWTIDCGDRGKITARKVIVCTNAHTPHLFPDSNISAHLCPFQGQAANITSPPQYSGSAYLDYTYVIENGPYLVSTPTSGLVMGLSLGSVFKDHIGDYKDIIGVVDDSYVKPEFKKWLEEYCPKTFGGWGPVEDQAPGEGATRVWSGIQCLSKDTLPLVGEVPGKQGLWVAVGHNGHGMARIPFLTHCLAKTLTSAEWDKGIPQSFKITDERLAKGREAPPFPTGEEKAAGLIAEKKTTSGAGEGNRGLASWLASWFGGLFTGSGPKSGSVAGEPEQEKRLNLAN
ncbi:hypothetical protein IAT40_000901 [Kwoniella sp. CBS 6097]